MENRLQAYKDKQTHQLPADDLGRLRLARAMGFPDWSSFAEVLDGHRRHVQGQFDQVFAAPRAEPADQDPDLAAVWRGTLDEARALEVLATRASWTPALPWRRLVAFREASARKGLSTRGGERLHQLLPLALKVIAASEAPDAALERVLKVLEAVTRRTAYLAMLVERPQAADPTRPAHRNEPLDRGPDRPSALAAR